MDLERAWFAACAAIADRRRDSHTTAAVDQFAAIPVLSATTLAKVLGLAIKTTIRLLNGLVDAGVAVEVTHRSNRRLFGFKGMASLGAAVHAPQPPLTPVERPAFNYSDPDAAMAFANQLMCQTRRALDALRCASPGPDATGGPDQSEGADAFPVPGIDLETSENVGQLGPATE